MHHLHVMSKINHFPFEIRVPFMIVGHQIPVSWPGILQDQNYYRGGSRSKPAMLFMSGVRSGLPVPIGIVIS